jgi:Cap4 dsDNA endonuclease
MGGEFKERMSVLVSEEPNTVAFPSVDDVKPDDEGGPISRSGFSYQDEIAVSFLIEMLETSWLLKVHCETHDDLLLVWAVEGRVSG